MKHIARDLVQAAIKRMDAHKVATATAEELVITTEEPVITTEEPVVTADEIVIELVVTTDEIVVKPVVTTDEIVVKPVVTTAAVVKPVITTDEVKPVITTDEVKPVITTAAVVNPVRYESSETAVIEKWRAAVVSNDVQITIHALIGMIQQLCLFSEPDKRCLRTYETDMDDVKKAIEKIRRRPHLMIDTSDIDTRDRVAMGYMLHNMRKMVGMFHVRDFMVRVEHAFDNSQIRSERYAMSRLAPAAGIDHANHVVVPIHIQMNSIENVPPTARTPFHHISYSIQPVVANSRTVDSWYRHTRPPRATVMALCKQMAEALVHLHAHNIVHGDIKPGNTLIQIPPNGGPARLYIIDFGMSGAHDGSESTGGTKPYCAPETGNGCNSKTREDMGSYHWTQTRMENDMWSFGLMFFTMMALHRCIYHPNEYPADFFNDDGHINAFYFDNISDDSIRELFERTLCPRETRYTAAEFLHTINQLG